MNFVTRIVPPMTHEERLHAINRALEHARSVGVSERAAGMNPPNEDIAAYAELAAKNELTTRIHAAPMETDYGGDQARLGIKPCFWFFLLEDRSGQRLRRRDRLARRPPILPTLCGQPRTRAACFPTKCSRSRECENGSLAPTKPDCSCASMRLATPRSRKCSIFSRRSFRWNGPRDRRLRIEHAQHMAAKDFDRFAQMKRHRLNAALSRNLMTDAGLRKNRTRTDQDHLCVSNLSRSRRAPCLAAPTGMSRR